MIAILVLLAAALGALPSPAAAQDADPAGRQPYVLGGGLPLGDSGVRLGGYVATEFENPTDARAAFTFDDLSLFVFGNLTPRVRFFVEAEGTQFLTADADGVSFDRNGDLERAYVVYLHADRLKVRAGKFLTPVGTWNEIHPDPLTWTVSRPVASYGTFPAFTTGVQAFGTWSTDTSDVDYTVFVQHNPSIDNSTGDRRTERLVADA